MPQQSDLTATPKDTNLTPTIFEKSRKGRRAFKLPAWQGHDTPVEDLLPQHLVRRTPLGLPEVGELDLVRHFISLSIKNHHIDKAMYPLGSCTMKYNPKVNEEAARLESFRGVHPLQDAADSQGCLESCGSCSRHCRRSPAWRSSASCRRPARMASIWR